jgi:hypothetical protein
MGRPAGRTHLPKRTGAIRAGFAVRDPTQRTISDRFIHLNESAQWRCAYACLSIRC